MRSKTYDNDVVVGIDKDKNSQLALKWAADHLVGRSRKITLVHVKPKTSSIITSSGSKLALCEVSEEVANAFKSTADSHIKEIFLPFKCFCTRKNIQVNEVILEDNDTVNALCNYVKVNSIENLVLGAHTKGYFSRKFMSIDIPGSVTKEAPAFCNVYVINKGKIASIRHGVGAPPALKSPKMPNSYSAPNLATLGTLMGGSSNQQSSSTITHNNNPKKPGSQVTKDNVAFRSYFETSSVQPKVSSPMTRDNVAFRSYFDTSNAQPKVSSTHSQEPFHPSHLSNYSVPDFRSSPRLPLTNISSHATNNVGNFSSYISESNGGSTSSVHDIEDEVDAEIRRLKEELKQRMEMYNTACEETSTVKQMAEQNKKSKESESEKKIGEAEEMKANSDVRYHKYTIEEIEVATDYFSESKKIGEGGYGPVYKCFFDHTPAAIKVLSPDIVHGMSQFHQEVEVLSNMRHPNMVHLLGACPENGCLVYEYMENGSLDDCLFRRGSNPVLSWQARFRITAEIATALLFLHQTKPEPLVHRDLKPGNILLDQNYVSKISDVGMARLVPPRTADAESVYRITKTAGTFCYIDPEYQLTGMLGTKSDVYSFGVMLLQIITAKSPMGLTRLVESAIETETLPQVLDPAVPDWPVSETLSFAKIALKCTELSRKQRPDIEEVLPELNRLKDFAQESMPYC